MARSNLNSGDFTWINARIKDVVEIVKDYCIKMVYTIINEYMEICKYKKSRVFFDL